MLEEIHFLHFLLKSSSSGVNLVPSEIYHLDVKALKSNSRCLFIAEDSVFLIEVVFYALLIINASTELRSPS